MHKSLIILTFSSAFFIYHCQPSPKTAPDTFPESRDSIMLGIDNLLANYLYLLEDERVGLLTNPSGISASLAPTHQLLIKHPQINLTTLYSPEHGFRGADYAGEAVGDTNDPLRSLPVYSLYGSQRKPSPESLKNVDVILVDIQDIGLRAYTFIYTMALVMEAAAENNKKVIILDRPNPIGGIQVEGNLVENSYTSFVGLYPIPYRHGMTIGELAILFNKEFHINCSLAVIPMQGWRRTMLWNNTGLQWIPTSPHVPHWETILYMGATGILGELGVLSEGVGYTSPFEMVGAPWIEAGVFADRLNGLKLPAVYFRPLVFRPFYARYKGETCQGVHLHITDPHQFEPYLTGLHIMKIHMELYPDRNLFEDPARVQMFDKVVGTDKIRSALLAGKSVAEIKHTWISSLETFKLIRSNYLIYK